MENSGNELGVTGVSNIGYLKSYNLTTLLGGFQCELTPQECNEWHKFLDDSVEMNRINEINIELKLIGIRYENGEYSLVDELLKLQKEAKELLQKLFYIGERWYFETIKEER